MIYLCHMRLKKTKKEKILIATILYHQNNNKLLKS